MSTVRFFTDAGPPHEVTVRTELDWGVDIEGETWTAHESLSFPRSLGRSRSSSSLMGAGRPVRTTPSLLATVRRKTFKLTRSGLKRHLLRAASLHSSSTARWSNDLSTIPLLTG